MKTSIAISCLLMGASFASPTATVARAADDRTHAADSQAEIDNAVVIGQRTEGVVAVQNALNLGEDA